MIIDTNATHYEYGNGRFDLMTDEELHTLTWEEFTMIFARLSDAMRHGESAPMQEVYHKLYELQLRHIGRDFRFEIVPPVEGNQ